MGVMSNVIEKLIAGIPHIQVKCRDCKELVWVSVAYFNHRGRLVRESSVPTPVCRTCSPRVNYMTTNMKFQY